jgi:addiction module HigA family antidote
MTDPTDLERIEWGATNTKQTRSPTPPGEVLQKEFLEPTGLTQSELARHIDRDVKTINRLVNGHTRLTPDVAQRLAATFGTTAEFWLNLQMAVDLYEVQQEADDLPEPITGDSQGTPPAVQG